MIRDAEQEAVRHTRQLQKQEKALRAEEDLALRGLLSGHEGRQFLWWLLTLGGVGLQPFAGDPHRTAFNCGELNVGQQILARILEVDPTGYLRILEDRTDAARIPAEPIGQHIIDTSAADDPFNN